MAKLPTTPIKEIDIPEISHISELQEILERIYEEGLPGFIIRDSMINAPVGQTYITHAISDTLPGVRKKSVSYEVAGRSHRLLETPFGIADLHHDMRSKEDSDRVRIHTTNKGGGKVWLANAGPGIAAHYFPDLGGTPIKQSLDDTESYFTRGLVDPDIVSPDVYTAELSAGNTVVFPLGLPPSDSHNQAGPLWHRFDTSSPDGRQATFWTIQPAEH